MKVQLIAMDLDGTLNNDEKRITPRTRDALLRVQDRGVRLALASARPSPGLLKEARALDLARHNGLLMAYNGGRIREAGTGKTLYETAMPLELARKALRFLENFPVTPILDDGERFYVTDKNAYMVAYEAQNNNMDCVEVDDLADFITFRPVKILMSGDPIVLPSIISTIRAPFAGVLDVVMTAPFYLEMIPAEVNKGKGLRDICRETGIDLAQTVAFGDAQNDIPLIRAAGLGVAMGNACEELKACADRVTASNNDDGIAQVLEQLEAEGRL